MSNLIPGNQKHLTLDNRVFIEKCLDLDMALKDIAKPLCKDPSIISKEIKKHRISNPHNDLGIRGPINRCINKKDCHLHKVCPNTSLCKGRCASCKKVNCNKVCTDFIPDTCKRLLNALALICAALLSPVFLLPVEGYIMANSQLYGYLEGAVDNTVVIPGMGTLQDNLLRIIAFFVLYAIFLIIVKIVLSSTRMIDRTVTGGIANKVLGLIGGLFGYVFFAMILMAFVATFSFLPIVSNIYQLLMQVSVTRMCMQHNLVFGLMQIVMGQ